MFGKVPGFNNIFHWKLQKVIVSLNYEDNWSTYRLTISQLNTAFAVVDAAGRPTDAQNLMGAPEVLLFLLIP